MNTASIIDGKAVSLQIQNEITASVLAMNERDGIVPGLAVVLVGDDPASRTYVNAKAKTCVKLGMYSINEQLPASTTERELLELIDVLNRDRRIHGILVQLPLPAHLNADRIISAINPLKDVDGLHAENAGLLALGKPRFVPCTPLGVLELLRRYEVPVRGAHVAIIGRSILVGRPLSVLLSTKQFGDATVTVCHSATRNLSDITRTADILVVAIGSREFVRQDMVRPGAVVIDVGTNVDENGKLKGDVCFAEVAVVASKITPVPGGVGPMTIAMLMRNTLHSANLAVARGLMHEPLAVS